MENESSRRLWERELCMADGKREVKKDQTKKDREIVEKSVK